MWRGEAGRQGVANSLIERELDGYQPGKKAIQATEWGFAQVGDVPPSQDYDIDFTETFVVHYPEQPMIPAAAFRNFDVEWATEHHGG